MLGGLFLFFCPLHSRLSLGIFRFSIVLDSLSVSVSLLFAPLFLQLWCALLDLVFFFPLIFWGLRGVEGVTLGSSGVSEDAAIPEGVFGFVAAKQTEGFR